MKLIQTLDEKQAQIWTFTAKVRKLAHEYEHMVMQLEAAGIELRIDIKDQCIDIGFTGDQERMNTIWKLLRANGWKPDYRPQKDKPTASFCSYWHKEGELPIWFSFSSTVCKQVQVGTRMVEQPIYEVTCE